MSPEDCSFFAGYYYGEVAIFLIIAAFVIGFVSAILLMKFWRSP